MDVRVSLKPRPQYPIDRRVQSDLVPLVQTVQVYRDNGLQWYPKFAYFGREFLIGYSIFRREKPFADEEQSC